MLTFKRLLTTAGILRTNLSIVGAMNAGKSTLMNLLTQQETSIVDMTPGTTADTKVSLMEMHSLGPVKLMDTPGLDEKGELGSKKRGKVMNAIKESDCILVVVNPESQASIEVARQVLSSSYGKSEQQNAQKLVLFNVQKEKLNQDLDLAKIDALVADSADAKTEVPSLIVDFRSPDAFSRVISFVTHHMKPREAAVSLLPPGIQFDSRSRVLLNIPMDAETPSGRLLRPQTMLQEALLRQYVGTFAYRMDLVKGRSSATDASADERMRFRDTLHALNSDGQLRLIVTDSQAIKEVFSWCSDIPVPITTFSIMMAHYMSGGRLPLFIVGIRAFDQLPPISRVLICEACTHDRIQDDIGTVQIHNALRRRFGEAGISIDHSFGRQYQTMDLHK